jgi:hypothetical protein
MTTLLDADLRTKENRKRKGARWKRDAEKCVRTMRVRGQLLILTYRNGTPHWRLGNAHVENGAAELVINHPNIVGVGDALFHDVRSQTYRYVGEN